MRHTHSLPVVAALLLGAAAPAFASGEGYHTVNGYSDQRGQIGFDLTQIGSYGELTLQLGGFANMGFGKCVMVFRRDADGAVAETTAVQQENAATCPSELAFTTKEADKGMLELTFTEGGPLAGKSYELFTVLRPYRDSDAITAPKGFDILGLTIGDERAATEAKLTADGFEKHEGYSRTLSYQDGSSRAMDVWAKGRSESGDKPEDYVYITWTMRYAELDAPEKIAFIGREWAIPSSANLALAALNRSLVEKHGAGAMEGHVYYDRAGTPSAKAFGEVCDDKIHLQSVSVPYAGVGMVSDGSSMKISCGASVVYYALENYSSPGRAGSLKIELRKADVAFADFWNAWAPGEEARLKDAFDLQSGSGSAAPKL